VALIAGVRVEQAFFAQNPEGTEVPIMDEFERLGLHSELGNLM